MKIKNLIQEELRNANIKFNYIDYENHFRPDKFYVFNPEETIVNTIKNILIKYKISFSIKYYNDFVEVTLNKCNRIDRNFYKVFSLNTDEYYYGEGLIFSDIRIYEHGIMFNVDSESKKMIVYLYKKSLKKLNTLFNLCVERNRCWPVKNDKKQNKTRNIQL